MPIACKYIVPDWPAPMSVRALTTLRQGGCSVGSYEGLNLSTTAGDDLCAVLHNRQILKETLNLEADPFWLEQQHGTRVVFVGDKVIQADATIATQPGEIACVLTADCLPILLCSDKQPLVAAVHAGWRGLAQGIVESTVSELTCERGSLMAWIGPAIGPKAFEVGQEVMEAFPNDGAYFFEKGNQKWLADLFGIAKARLQRLGISRVFGGEFCTYSDERFYSYRRSHPTGRMASLIWMET